MVSVGAICAIVAVLLAPRCRENFVETEVLWESYTHWTAGNPKIEVDGRWLTFSIWWPLGFYVHFQGCKSIHLGTSKLQVSTSQENMKVVVLKRDSSHFFTSIQWFPRNESTSLAYAVLPVIDWWIPPWRVTRPFWVYDSPNFPWMVGYVFVPFPGGLDGFGVWSPLYHVETTQKTIPRFHWH